MFEDIIRFWLDRGVAGLRVDVAHGIFKDPELADAADTVRSVRPSGYYHRPETLELYRSWRAILDSYPVDVWPGPRTAIGEVWYDTYATLQPYLAPDVLPQVFNFELVTAQWDALAIRKGIDATLALTTGSRAPWVIGNHDVVRPVTRWGVAPARAAALLLLLALPGSAYVYQGEELGLPEVLDIPDAARQDPAFRRTGGKVRGRDGCRVPLPWERGGASFGFSGTDPASSPAPPWLPQPAYWGAYSVAAERGDPLSFLRLYQAALRLRGENPALGVGELSGGAAGGGAGGDAGGGAAPAGEGAIRWLDAPDDALVFARDPGFAFAANLGSRPLPLPPHREVLLASGALAPDGALPRDTAVWLAT
jgi:alpha-glucosidase